MKPFNALVLAGRRRGKDPLAESVGVSHRALLDVIGIPMLVRVVRALRAANSVDQIVVSIDDPHLLVAVPELKALLEQNEIIQHASLHSPSRSVQDALDSGLLGDRVLIVTADHALLTPEIVDHFASRAEQLDTDVAVGVVAEEVVRSAFPDVTRTYLRFRDGGYSGANLFVFRNQQSRRAAEFWVKAENFRKRPWQLASTFGPISLLLFVLRRLRFSEALERASRSIGCRIRGVPLPFAEAAIDVDRPSDLALVSKILAERERPAD